ncbi:MAG: hypothetical protein IJT91_04000 [Clostridia bacterium]|nr:hypothetical protein [Clostridia bacterium]
MMGKLMKYDLRNMWRSIFPFSIGLFGLTVIACFVTRYLNNPGFILAQQSNDAFKRALTTISIIYMTMFALGFAAFALLSVVFIIKRYYDNFFTDEGYLTFTLPLKTSTLLGSKLISAVIAFLAVIIFMGVCMFIFILFGFSTHGLIDKEVLESIGNVLRSLFSEETALTVIILIFTALTQMIFNIAFFLLCITIGSIITRKHKILAAVALYYGISFFLGTVVGILVNSFILTPLFSDPYFDETPIINSTLLITMLIYAGGAAAVFLINNRLLAKKLNLN